MQEQLATLKPIVTAWYRFGIEDQPSWVIQSIEKSRIIPIRDEHGEALEFMVQEDPKNALSFKKAYRGDVVVLIPSSPNRFYHASADFYSKTSILITLPYERFFGWFEEVYYPKATRYYDDHIGYKYDYIYGTEGT